MAKPKKSLFLHKIRRGLKKPHLIFTPESREPELAPAFLLAEPVAVASKGLSLHHSG
jgi:hypothetical protein